MQRVAWLAAASCLLGTLVAACSPNGAGPGGDGGAGSIDGGDATSGSSSGSGSGSSSSGGSTDGGGHACDSGGPFVLESVRTLPAVTPSGVAFDGQGDLYVTGIFNGAVTFGTTTLTAPTAPGTENMFLVKYDPAGNVLFATSYGTPTGNYVNPAIAVDPAGDVFLGGGFADTLDFGGASSPLVATGYVDAFAAKISPTGATQWAERFGYDQGPYAVLSIAVGPDGNPVVAGAAAGTIILGPTTWYQPLTGTNSQPFIAKLSTASGAVLWSNATGGDMDSGEDIWIAIDASGRVFVAARVESGGGAWGVEPDTDAGNFGALRAGFDANGQIMWGQVDYGSFPMAAAVDSEGRFSVIENAYDAVVVGGGTTFGSAQTGFGTVSLLFSPTDGTQLSGIEVDSTFPWSGAVDAHGNTVLTGTYWPKTTPIPVGGLSLPAGGGGENQPLFVAALDGASNAVAVATLGASNDAQPLLMAVDPVSGKTFVAATLETAFTSSVGPIQPGTFFAVFGPDPCDDGAGPSGPSTGNPSNHGDLAPDGGSPYVGAEAAAPAPCPSSASGATNGAACPVAMGCAYGSECCFCSPMSCNGASTTWTCDPLQNSSSCPASPPAVGTACSPTSLQCNYCLPGGRFFAQCMAGQWDTGYAQILCE